MIEKDEINAIFHEKEMVLEIMRGNEQINDFIIYNDDCWFACNVGIDERFFNLIKEEGKWMLGMFSTKMESGKVVTGDFLNNIEIKLV